MTSADEPGRTKVVRLRIYVQADNIRIERPGAGQTIIARLKDNVVWSIDEKSGQYYETTFENIAARWRRMRRAEGIQEGGPGAVLLKRSEEKKSIMWHTCAHYIVSVGDKMVLELWADNDFDFPEKETIYRFRARMGEFSPDVLREIEKVPGFPLRMNGFTYVGDERMISLREVKSIQRRDIDPAQFTLPDGLRKATAAE